MVIVVVWLVISLMFLGILLMVMCIGMCWVRCIQLKVGVMFGSRVLLLLWQWFLMLVVMFLIWLCSGVDLFIRWMFMCCFGVMLCRWVFLKQLLMWNELVFSSVSIGLLFIMQLFMCIVWLLIWLLVGVCILVWFRLSLVRFIVVCVVVSVVCVVCSLVWCILVFLVVIRFCRLWLWLILWCSCVIEVWCLVRLVLVCFSVMWQWV